MTELYVPDEICPGCGVGDPECVVIDLGIGFYEYWGAAGYHTDEVLVTRCCEAQPELFATEPNDNFVSEGLVV